MTIARFPPQRRTGGPDRIPLPATATKSLMLRLAAIAGVVAAVAVLLNVSGALDYLSFAELVRNREWLDESVQDLGYAAPLVFVVVYALCTAFSLPTGRWCSEFRMDAVGLSALVVYTMRTDSGHPTSIMRLRTATPMAASAC